MKRTAAAEAARTLREDNDGWALKKRDVPEAKERTAGSKSKAAPSTRIVAAHSQQQASACPEAKRRPPSQDSISQASVAGHASVEDDDDDEVIVIKRGGRQHHKNYSMLVDDDEVELVCRRLSTHTHSHTPCPPLLLL